MLEVLMSNEAYKLMLNEFIQTGSIDYSKNIEVINKSAEVITGVIRGLSIRGKGYLKSGLDQDFFKKYRSEIDKMKTGYDYWYGDPIFIKSVKKYIEASYNLLDLLENYSLA